MLRFIAVSLRAWPGATSGLAGILSAIPAIDKAWALAQRSRAQKIGNAVARSAAATRTALK
ncbi:MAG: hypothetical protein AB7K86_24990 [Rhodospirillales bacterium]